MGVPAGTGDSNTPVYVCQSNRWWPTCAGCLGNGRVPHGVHSPATDTLHSEASKDSLRGERRCVAKTKKGEEECSQAIMVHVEVIGITEQKGDDAEKAGDTTERGDVGIENPCAARPGQVAHQESSNDGHSHRQRPSRP